MQKVIHTPGLSAVRFTGTFDKKLFELGGRVHPLLKAENENIIIVTEVQALLLSKQAHFEKVNLEDIFANEKTPPSTETNSTETEEEYIPPFIEDLNSLSIDDLKKACAYFNITVGNKKRETLQSLLIPFLKNRE